MSDFFCKVLREIDVEDRASQSTGVDPRERIQVL